MDNKDLKKRIAFMQKVIKKKFLDLKMSRAEMEHALEQQYDPIMKPLKTIASKIDGIKPDEPKVEPKVESFSEYLEKYPPIVRNYVKASIRDNSGKNFDYKYGPRYQPDEDKWQMGNAMLDFTNNDTIVVNNESFQGTNGLYELMFKTAPNTNIVTNEDVLNYQKLLEITSAHRKHYDPTKKFNSSKHSKWTKIIKPLFPKKGGEIFMEVTNKPFDYRYWDNPNELVDRLRLLWAEQDAGHTGHNNEINAILEELKEAHIIW